VGPAQKPGEAARVSLADTGIGIPPESQARIFEEFYRAPKARKVEAHGTGLGLTFVKRIVEEHGGGRLR